MKSDISVRAIQFLMQQHYHISKAIHSYIVIQ